MREYLKDLRVQAGMSMADVAERFDISRQYYEMIESGDRQRKMDITLIAKISSVFGVPMEQIVENEKTLYPDVWGASLNLPATTDTEKE